MSHLVPVGGRDGGQIEWGWRGWVEKQSLELGENLIRDQCDSEM